MSELSSTESPAVGEVKQSTGVQQLFDALIDEEVESLFPFAGTAIPEQEIMNRLTEATQARTADRFMILLISAGKSIATISSSSAKASLLVQGIIFSSWEDDEKREALLQLKAHIPLPFLHMAVKLGGEAGEMMAKFLLSKGISDIGEKGVAGYTALHWAAHQGSVEMLAILIKNKASLNEKNEYGDSAINVAADKNHLSIVGILLAEGALVEGNNLMLSAINNNNPEMMQCLLDKISLMNHYFGDTNLLQYIAGCENISEKMAEMSLGQKGISLKVKESYGASLLYLAVQSGSLSMVRTLLRHKALIEEVEELLGQTPLHLAVDPKNFEKLKLLLLEKANVNAQDKQGRSTLEKALSFCENPSDNIPVIRLLLEYKAMLEPEHPQSSTLQKIMTEIKRSERLALLAGSHNRVGAQGLFGHLKQSSLWDKNILRLPLKISGSMSAPSPLSSATSSSSSSSATVPPASLR